MKIFEFIMLACFGLSWPISVYKSFTSKSTKGKSVVFIIAIIIGYISGILGKIINNDAGSAFPASTPHAVPIAHAGSVRLTAP